MERVADYPRPPRLEASSRHVRVWFGGVCIADSLACWRVLETFHPPTWYVPAEAVRRDLLHIAPRQSFCEYKGVAHYVNLTLGQRSSDQCGWLYPAPRAPYQALAGAIAFYPGRVDACDIDGEVVRPQPGDYYGGWITAELIGPFKGEPGTEHW